MNTYSSGGPPKGAWERDTRFDDDGRNPPQQAIRVQPPGLRSQFFGPLSNRVANNIWASKGHEGESPDPDAHKYVFKWARYHVFKFNRKLNSYLSDHPDKIGEALEYALSTSPRELVDAWIDLATGHGFMLTTLIAGHEETSVVVVN